MILLNLKKNAVSSIVEQLLTGAAFFLIYGILIRLRGPDEVGVMALVLVLASLGQTANVGFGNALMHFVPASEGKGEHEYSAHYIETACLSSIALFGVFAAIVYIPFKNYVNSSVDAHYHLLVGQLMMPAALGVVFANVASVALSALMALQKGFVRSVLASAGVIICLLFTLLGAREHGAIAVVWGMAAQSLFTFVASWCVLVRALPGLHAIPRSFSTKALRSLLSLGLKLQILNLCLLLIEPVTRILLGRFGSLSQVTYFSMAWRLVVQVRGLIYSASYSMVPALGLLEHSDPARLELLYRRFHGLIGLTAIPALLTVAAFAPVIGEIWIGSREKDFEIYSLLLALGWLTSTITLAPFFRSLSTGYMKWNIYGHLTMGAINCLAGAMMAYWLGPTGAVAAVAASLTAGGLLISVGNEVHFGTKARDVITARDFATAAGAFISVIFGLFVYNLLRPMLGISYAAAALCVLWLALIFPLIWLHPSRRDLMNLLGYSGKKS